MRGIVSRRLFVEDQAHDILRVPGIEGVLLGGREHIVGRRDDVGYRHARRVIVYSPKWGNLSHAGINFLFVEFLVIFIPAMRPCPLWVYQNSPNGWFASSPRPLPLH